MSDVRATQRRQCSQCGRPDVVCFHVTQHMLNGVLPIGRTYEHHCAGCKARFETESIGRTIWNLVLGGLWFLFGVGGTIFIVGWALDFFAGRTGTPSLGQVGVGAVMLLMLVMGIGVPARSIWRNVNLFRNPVV